MNPRSTVTPGPARIDSALSPPASAAVSLEERYAAVRRFSGELCAPLSAEDCVIQSMPDVSPTKWHLAHTTWFFETFVLSQWPDYRPRDASYGYLFNSYYETVGRQFPRPRRGLLSRPPLDEVLAYREHVDRHMRELLTERPDLADQVASVIELGLQHEQQHQELMLTDIKHVLSCHPDLPAYRAGDFADLAGDRQGADVAVEEGVYEIGHRGADFAYDNESPRHRVFLDRCELSGRLVTCGDYLRFMEDGGYCRPELWLSLGWQSVQQQEWTAPLYWHRANDEWQVFTLSGCRPVDPDLPVCHVSYFEADAYARWAGGRLPTEAEWEVAAEELPIAGNFADRLMAEGRALHPGSRPAAEAEPRRMFGDVWEWTASPYTPYPGYSPPEGALGEYNGKFMCNQYVLRGGSCATSASHLRKTYRNFFPPEARWQFTGIRLVR